MFQSIFDGFLQAILNLPLWSWAHPVAAGLMLSGIALILLMWLHIPKRLEYYWQNGQVTINPFNVRNELPQYVRGRIAVLYFCRQHRINLAFGRRIGFAFLELFLKLVRIPDPYAFSWDGGFCAIQVYPLGHSRREYVGICIQQRIWPWKRTATLQRILAENHGYLPGLEEATAWGSLVNRLYS